MSDFVKLQATWTEQPLNAAHPLPPLDIPRTFDVVAVPVGRGTLLKDSASSVTPWIQGTDAEALITGIYTGEQDLDTAKVTTGLVRIFGPIRKDALVAWAIADGSTQAAPTQAALDALRTNAGLTVFAL